MKILLIDDDLELAQILTKAMRERQYLFHLEKEGMAGCKVAMKGGYDVIIVEQLLPGMNGLRLIKKLRKHNIWTPILILSELDEVQHKVDGLRAGADDYLAKPFFLVELFARIEALARRQPINKITQSELVYADLKLNRSKKKAYRCNIHLNLKFKEYLILEFLMRHIDELVTKTMLIEHIWDSSDYPKSNIVEVHISRLRRKLDKGFDIPLLHTRRNLGYTLSVRNAYE